MVLGFIMGGREHHKDIVVNHFDLVRLSVVSEGIESATGREVEASVMPMAREEALLDSPTVEGETHVRASIQEREWRAFGPEHADGL
jgi:hypothetical protein